MRSASVGHVRSVAWLLVVLCLCFVVGRVLARGLLVDGSLVVGSWLVVVDGQLRFEFESRPNYVVPPLSAHVRGGGRLVVGRL